MLFSVRFSGAQARNEPSRCGPGVASSPRTAFQVVHEFSPVVGSTVDGGCEVDADD